MQNALPIEPVSPPVSVQLYHGDCLEVMPTLRPKSVAMIFADLPYALAKRRSTQNTWDLPFDLDKYWSSTAPLTADKGCFLMTATQPFSSHLVHSNSFSFRYELIWQKTNITGFFLAKRAPLRNHESVLYFAKSLGTYNPIMTPVGPDNTYRPKTIYKSVSRSKIYGGAGVQPHRQDKGIRYPRSVLSIASEARQNSLHPTQKPIALLEWLIKTYTNPGDTVLDPVFGSCTTGIACLRTGRNFIGIEKDAGYFEIGRQRIADEQARLGHPVTV